jgi:hypothetical protein
MAALQDTFKIVPKQHFKTKKTFSSYLLIVINLDVELWLGEGALADSPASSHPVCACMQKK